jgi:peptidoglycan/xylan/chitin deacetylase (PgdA/CDA1 family)
MRLFRLPQFIRNLLPQLEWQKSPDQKAIYLTFDDGPIPEVTDFVLEQLVLYGAKGTFFCVGDNLVQNPEVAARVIASGHRLGNHTFNHLKAWKTPSKPYLQNVEKCAAALQVYLTEEERSGQQKPLFRPPYGQVSLNKIKALVPKYRVIMWDLLTCDYDQNLAPEACLQNSIDLTRPGSIVVFHDSLKARRNLEFVLPRYLKHFHQLGYRFEAL